MPEVDERDGDGQQQQPPTLTEQRDDLEKRTDFYLRFYTGTDDVDDVRGTLEKAASEGRGDAKRLLEEHDSLEEMLAEEQKRRDDERKAQEFSSELDRVKAQVRADRAREAEEEAQKVREAKLRAQAEAELETEVAVGAGGTETDLSRFNHLQLQHDQLDPSSGEAESIREQMVEVAASMERGDERVADVDPAEFERSL